MLDGYVVTCRRSRVSVLPPPAAHARTVPQAAVGPGSAAGGVSPQRRIVYTKGRAGSIPAGSRPCVLSLPRGATAGAISCGISTQLLIPFCRTASGARVQPSKEPS